MIKRTKTIVKLIAAVLVASNVLATGMPGYSINVYAAHVDTSAVAKENGLTENIKDGVILHAWCWSFNTIKNNMADIAAAGFTTVQTSPANTCLDSYPTMKIMGTDEGGGTDGVWWWHYQPTDWNIGNYQLGSRDDFKAMCDEADKYGIKVIVDVIPNHTTPTLNKVSQDLINAAGGQDELYHANGFNKINDWNDRAECTTGQMGGLPDVNTENPGFQKYFLNYLNDCIECGADGFRYDTAKHIGLPSDPMDANTRNNGWRNNFWPVATGKESVDGVHLEDSDRIFNYGEVLQDKNVKEKEYEGFFHQTASSYGDTIRDAIRGKNFSVNNIMNYNHPADPSTLVTWVESHDTYCNDGKSADLNDWQLRMAYALITARKDGTPLFYSRPDGSSGKNNRWGKNVLGAKGNDQFKEPEVVAVNKFRNAMVGESEYLRNINGSSQILAIERGKKGEVIINLGGETSINYDTSLVDGKYKDQVSGKEFIVSNGKISGQLDGGKVAVIYNRVDPQPVSSVSAKPGNENSVYSYSTDTVDVTLNSSNLASAKYSIDGAAEVAYTNGTKISIGTDKAAGELTTLKLTGVANDGSIVSKSYTYKEVDDSVDKAGVYFKKPVGWGNSVNVYIYDEKSGASVKTIAQWPGIAMINLGNDEYFFELPESWKNSNTQVIFNDGNNQLPGARQPGLEYSLGKAMKYEDGNWNEVSIRQDKPLVSGKITTNVSSPQNVGTPITINTENATGGSGNYTYEFKVNDTVIKASSSDKSVVWTPKAEGTYTVTVTTKDSKGQEAVATKTFVINAVQITKEVEVTALTTKVSGNKVIITANAASKSNADLVYKFYVHEGINGWKALTDFTSNNEVAWTPSILGNSIIWVEARDNNGNKDIKFANFSLIGGITK